jgi:integrase
MSDVLTVPTPRPEADPFAAAPTRDRSALGCPELGQADFQTLACATKERLEPYSAYEAARRLRGMRLVLDWLTAFPGDTWQARWVASGSDRHSRPWPETEDKTRRALLLKGTESLICLNVLHPDYRWLIATKFLSLYSSYARASSLDELAQLSQALEANRVGVKVRREAEKAFLRIRIATGKPLTALDAGDVIVYDRAIRAIRPTVTAPQEALWGALRSLGRVVGPATLKAARYRGPLSVEEMVNRYQLAYRPIRDLIVGYLTDRAQSLDYNSLSSLAFWLAGLFWADLERHHPGIDSLQIPHEAAKAWKERLAVRPDGKPRANRGIVLVTVKAFYADINQWAYEDPARWARWAATCPVTKSDLAQRRKQQARVTARMHARTRTLAEVLPSLVAAADQRRKHAQALLPAAQAAPPGAIVVVEGQAYRRLENKTKRSRAVRVLPPDRAEPMDAWAEEAEAFWAWAAIEVLRLSGLRIEEVMELTHLSIRRYTQPDGQIIPLLQVAPSKMDAERVFPISPELAHVLAHVVARVRRDAGGTVPLTPRYDTHERIWGDPLPHLFQRPFGGTQQVFSPETVRNWLDRTASLANLRDVDGQPLRFTPHDFRRLFTTDVVNSGLPIHIAAALLGHRALDTTRGYAAIYPQEVINAYQAFIHQRRTQRPTEEYREPTQAEWDEFEQHFTLRQVAYGNCDRPYGTPCIHEHVPLTELVWVPFEVNSW